MTDREGVTRGGASAGLSRGERTRFESVVMPYFDAAYNLARHLLRDAHEAEDVVQDSLLKAFRHFAGFRGGDGRAWLLTIVRNSCISHLRNRLPRGESVEFDEEAHGLAGGGPWKGPEENLARVEAVTSVREALARLPVEFREALVLRELEGLSYKEIAEVTGAPIGTVMSRLARGREQLQRALAAAEPTAATERKEP